MKTKIDSSAISHQILGLLKFLGNPSGNTPNFPLIFTDEFIRSSLGSERVEHEGREQGTCIWRLQKRDSRTWSALLQMILPLTKGRLEIFEEFVTLSPFEGSAIIPFIEGNTKREFDFTHLEHILNQSFDAKGHGVVLVTSGVAIIDPPKKRDLHALEILGSG